MSFCSFWRVSSDLYSSSSGFFSHIQLFGLSTEYIFFISIYSILKYYLFSFLYLPIFIHCFWLPSFFQHLTIIFINCKRIFYIVLLSQTLGELILLSSVDFTSWCITSLVVQKYVQRYHFKEFSFPTDNPHCSGLWECSYITILLCFSY